MTRCARSTASMDCVWTALRKGLDPRHRVSRLVEDLLRVVVALTVALELCAEVQQWSAEPMTGLQEEDEQPPAEAPIAVEEGMDRLELRVQQGVLGEQRQLRLLVGEALPVGHQR